MLVLFVVKCILVILMARPSSLAVFDFIHKVNGGLLHSAGTALVCLTPSNSS